MFQKKYAHLSISCKAELRAWVEGILPPKCCARALPAESERTLTGLLCELVWFFASDLKAPRWAAGEVAH
ncbi:hypothetical protein EGM70_13020 [Enterobacteriaceae bacterium 89]|nr:hypothetical protein [Enterobacteriaceae bacterium 89]